MPKQLLHLKKQIMDAIQAKDWPLAAQLIRDLCRLEDTPENRMQLASACMRADRVNDARAIYLEQEKLHPDDLGLIVNLGLCEYRLKDFQESLKRFESVLARDPSVYIAQIYAARSLYHLAVFDRAKGLCLGMIKGETDKSEVYDLLGHTCRALGEQSGAIHAYRRSLEILPNNGQTLMALAITYEAVGDTDQAIYFYESCVAVGWDSASAYKNLGRIFLAQGDHRRSISCLQRAVELDPH
ncbi:MAG: tetratricopeptide repeat protein, partial [Burkholderiaceae bacterium]